MVILVLGERKAFYGIMVKWQTRGTQNPFPKGVPVQVRVIPFAGFILIKSLKSIFKKFTKFNDDCRAKIELLQSSETFVEKLFIIKKLDHSAKAVLIDILESIGITEVTSNNLII